MIEVSWINLVAGLVIGFLLKLLFDELRSPRLRVLKVSRTPFQITLEIGVVGEGFDNVYTAYRVRVENKQKRFLNNAAENCTAWLDLNNAPESYQLSWVGGSELTINVGDIREVDFCAKGNTTCKIYAPTERGYFAPEPRLIGDGKAELLGKLRITSKNGKKEEKPFVIKPTQNQLEITILDEEQEARNASVRESSIRSLRKIQEIISSDWARKYLFKGLFIGGIVAVAGFIIFIYSKVPITEEFSKATRASAISINVAAILGLIAAYSVAKNRWLSLILTFAIYALVLGMIFQLISYL